MSTLDELAEVADVISSSLIDPKRIIFAHKHCIPAPSIQELATEGVSRAFRNALGFNHTHPPGSAGDIYSKSMWAFLFQFVKYFLATSANPNEYALTQELDCNFMESLRANGGALLLGGNRDAAYASYSPSSSSSMYPNPPPSTSWAPQPNSRDRYNKAQHSRSSVPTPIPRTPSPQINYAYRLDMSRSPYDTSSSSPSSLLQRQPSSSDTPRKSGPGRPPGAKNIPRPPSSEPRRRSARQKVLTQKSIVDLRSSADIQYEYSEQEQEESATSSRRTFPPDIQRHRY